ncbi:MAG TPA: AarF/ABC1/UbiB kinase family protein [Desulfobacteraceae bacterium]|nr:AarF/ABC1/UbiB kinase family protein [Desulfobacteraceae bacterium]
MFSIRKMTAIGRTYRHLNRYQRILRVLFKYGFSDLVDMLHIDQYLETGLQMINRKPREMIEKHSRPERLRMAFEELGPTFIKLGQLLSTRPDFVPPEYLEELSRLQDDVPPFPFAEVEEIVFAETGKKPLELFHSFEEQPIAAASIGQVHRAILWDFQEVVVKVQRPDIDQIVAVDLEILAHLSSLMEMYLEELQGHRPTAIVEEFARTLSNELDYSVEISNIQRFARQFEGNKTVYVPRVYRELSTDRILTMENIKGIKSSNIDALRQDGTDLRLVAERGTNLIMEQIFVHGFFHADPHPGNIFILPGNVICFIDFGMMGRITRQNREDFTELLFQVIERNERKVTDIVLKLTNHYEEVDRDALGRDLSEMLDRYLYLPLKEMEAGKILQQLLDLVSRHKIYFKPNLYLMMKAISTVEGVGLMLYPELELIRLAEPFMRKVKADKVSLGRIADETGSTTAEYFELIRELPEEIRAILRQVRQGRMKLEFEHLGLEKLRAVLDQVSNRISFAIVLAALIIGSSVIVHSNIPPRWNDIPIIGLIGFLIAGVMGFWLLISIIRHGRL